MATTAGPTIANAALPKPTAGLAPAGTQFTSYLQAPLQAPPVTPKAPVSVAPTAPSSTIKPSVIQTSSAANGKINSAQNLVTTATQNQTQQKVSNDALVINKKIEDQMKADAAKKAATPTTAAPPTPATPTSPTAPSGAPASGTADISNMGLRQPEGQTYSADQPPAGMVWAYDKSTGARQAVPTSSFKQGDLMAGSTDWERNADMDNLFNTFKDTVTQFNQQTFALSPDEQAQVDALQLKFDNLRKSQQEFNKNYQGGVGNLEIASGRSRYAAEISLGNIQNAINQGLSKVADIEGKASEAISALRSEFENKWETDQEKKWERISDLYTKANTYLKDKTVTIKDINKSVEEEAKNLLDRQKAELEMVKSNADTYAASLLSLNPTTGDVEMPSNEDLAALAKTSGIPVANLRASMLQKAYDLSKLSSEDRLREVNIQKAQADLLYAGMDADEKQWSNAKARGEFSGSLLDWIKAKKTAETSGEMKIVKIDGVDYVQNADGSLTKPNLPTTATSTAEIEKSKSAMQLVKNSLANAEKYVGAAGRSGARKTWESWTVGATDYTNLVAETNTLRTNVLTMMTDPNIKKFFGPQMSNADVQLMTSAGTTLNPELQTPATMKEELKRLKDFVNRAEQAVTNAASQTPVSFDQWQSTASPEIQNKIDSALLNPAYGKTMEERKANILELYSGGVGKTSEQQSSLKGTLEQKFPTGSTGGQCGTFAHNIVNFPPVGDSINEKKQAVAKYGQPASTWRQNPKIGDVIIFDKVGSYGHVAVVNSVLPNGQVRLTESNWDQQRLGREKVQNSRLVSINDPKIYGAIRGTLKV